MRLQAANSRRLQEMRDRAWLAWHVAVLGRAKKVPRLQALLPKDPGPERRGVQDWRQQLAAAMSIHAAVTARKR